MTAYRKRRFGRVRKLSSGRYRARYEGPDGMDHPAPTTFGSRGEAERFLSMVESDIASGRWLTPAAGRITVREWGDRWYRASLNGWKPKTRNTYHSVLQRLIYPHLGRVTLAALRPITIASWVGKLGERLGPSPGAAGVPAAGADPVLGRRQRADPRLALPPGTPSAPARPRNRTS